MSDATEWPKAAVKALIKSYKEQPLLYDAKMTHLYYNKQARQTAIDKILAEVVKHRPGTTNYEINRKIQVLRTQYGQEVGKIKKSKKYGDEYVYTPKIWWFTELDFLKDFMKTRPKAEKSEPVITDNDETTESEIVSTPPSNPKKKIRLSEDNNITIVDRTGGSISEITSPSSAKSNKYVIYENDSYIDDPDHQSEIIVEPYTKPVENKKHEDLGKFVAAQMGTIKDEILFYQTQHEILSVINKAILKQLEKNISGGRGIISVALETE